MLVLDRGRLEEVCFKIFLHLLLFVVNRLDEAICRDVLFLLIFLEFDVELGLNFPEICLYFSQFF